MRGRGLRITEETWSLSFLKMGFCLMRKLPNTTTPPKKFWLCPWYTLSNQPWKILSTVSMNQLRPDYKLVLIVISGCSLVVTSHLINSNLYINTSCGVIDYLLSNLLRAESFLSRAQQIWTLIKVLHERVIQLQFARCFLWNFREFTADRVRTVCIHGTQLIT